MFKDEYGKRKNTTLLLLLITLVLVMGSGIFFYIHKDITRGNLASIDAADYSSSQFVHDKTDDAQSAGIALTVQTHEDLRDDIYHSPLGFPIVSYSDQWQGDKLKEIYEELLKNTHGKEIMYISKVVVHPGKSEIGLSDSYIAGAHSTTLEDYAVFFDVPVLVPKSLKYNLQSTLSVIELYNMDEYETIDQAARTIAHEYGHHYTMHYFMQNDDAAKASEYYNLRNIADIKQEVFFDDEDSYLENHQWSIYELAAEDYVQLLGSPTAKQPKEYLDVYDVLLSYSDEVYYIKSDETTVNVFPQENIYLPLADEVSGLREYFYSFADLPNENIPEYTPIEPVDFELSMVKHTKRGNEYYDIVWEKPTSDEDALYTLVCYDMNGNIFSPVKTVNGDEDAIAKVGTVSRVVGTTLYTSSNKITEQDRYFKIYLMRPDGRMQSSELFYADF